MTIHLYLDEDAMDAALIRALRARGVDVLTAGEKGMIERTEEDHLVRRWRLLATARALLNGRKNPFGYHFGSTTILLSRRADSPSFEFDFRKINGIDAQSRRISQCVELTSYTHHIIYFRPWSMLLV